MVFYYDMDAGITDDMMPLIVFEWLRTSFRCQK